MGSDYCMNPPPDPPPDPLHVQVANLESTLQLYEDENTELHRQLSAAGDRISELEEAIRVSRSVSP